ncbi:uncharacterized protein MELLADRAFT_76373 [Melampsora larici-populina 98AG31]|uniref:Uncharacterized protein n=1 Tax=Melampsora larici-populina (strain 98AG31 / pathotype 3-4-7) TaxID=747676 RepID=F4R4L5_MELLP|nr:uncharacterized protein MELLADRAFT_76373 [Melampsora larici-populina 98AG31]EGG12829.1 hypothetical protein MELLADRAFT_76373 [Melampsora larici-populina 98AG31]
MAQIQDQDPLWSQNDRIKSNRPLSVQEWRKSVFMSTQLRVDSRQSDKCESSGLSQVEIDWSSHQPYVDFIPNRPRSQTCQLPTPVQSYRKRQSLRITPLIDLNQPRDASGRPITYEEDERRRRERAQLLTGRFSNKSTPGLSSGSLLVIDDELEVRHRAAMRRLQAEAIDQIEQAEMLQQRRMARCRQSRSSTVSKSRGTGFDSQPESPTRTENQHHFDIPYRNTKLDPRPVVGRLVQKGSAKILKVVRSIGHLRHKASRPLQRIEPEKGSSSQSFIYVEKP